jgi:TolB-like protein
MTDIFISYARGTADQAHRVAEALRALGYGVWRDDELPAHRAYAEVIEERLKAAKAVVVIWSAEAAKSEWVRSEADRARGDRKLVQLSVDGAQLPMPFDQIQCADMAGWVGDTQAPGWRKVVASLGEIVGAVPMPVFEAPTFALPSKPSIAVMPFANLSGDPEQEYFADGTVVEITNALTRFRSLFVIAGSSTLTFKSKNVAAQDAARQLGVRYVLEGSVRKGGERVRIAVQLIDATDGTQIWAHRFDDTLEDIFELQDRIALSVAGKVEPSIISAEYDRVTAGAARHTGCHDLYLRAATSWVQDGPKALELLERAIELDPFFAPALALAAHLCRNFHLVEGFVEDRSGYREKAIKLAHQALAIAGSDAIVLANVAVVLGPLEGDLDAALTLVDRAISLNPGSADVWIYSAELRVLADDPRAVEDAETSLRLDPLSPIRGVQLFHLASALFSQRRFADTLSPLREIAQTGHAVLTPWVEMMMAASCGHLGHREAARDAIMRARVLKSDLDLRTDVPMGLGTVGQQLLRDGLALVEEKAS